MARYERNYGKNGIELYFDSVPTEKIRDELKANDWQWSRNRQCWYKKYSPEDLEYAKYICGEKTNIKNSANESVRVSIEETPRKETNIGKPQSVFNRPSQSKLKVPVKEEKLFTEIEEGDLELTGNEEGIFAAYSKCLTDRGRLKSFLSDSLLGNKLQVNIILAAYDMGIVGKINNSNKIDNTIFKKWLKQLQDEAGLTQENAFSSLDFWCLEYGKNFQRKELSYDKYIADNEESTQKKPAQRNHKSAEKHQNKPQQKSRGRKKKNFLGVGDLFFNEDDIEIEYRGLKQDIGSIRLILFVKNDSDDDVTIKINELEVNDFQIDIYGSRVTCLAHKKVIGKDFCFFNNDLKMISVFGINDITDLKVKMNIYYTDAKGNSMIAEVETFLDTEEYEN